MLVIMALPKLYFVEIMCNIFLWFVAHMRINIPWKNLSSEQTVINLDGIYVVIVPNFSMYLLFI